MDAPSPARKAHAHEINEKGGGISNIFELPWPVQDLVKKTIDRLCAGFEPQGASSFRKWVKVPKYSEKPPGPER
jgi:hypothetical protein